MSKSSKFSGLARRLKNAGLKISRSDRSETIYVSVGKRELRISGHELGVADYGTREQKHIGPEVLVAAADEVATVVSECIFQTRQYLRDYACYWSASERCQAAAALCGFRRLESSP